jgi:hypothetical protein
MHLAHTAAIRRCPSTSFSMLRVVGSTSTREKVRSIHVPFRVWLWLKRAEVLTTCPILRRCAS